MYYKIIENNIITTIGTLSRANDSVAEITEIEYNNLLSVVANKPVDTLEYIYRLSAETNQYEKFSRTHEETVEWYFQKVANGEMTIEEVPMGYKAEVEAKLPQLEQPTCTLDEAATILASGLKEGE